MPREFGQNFHQEEQQRDGYPQPCHEAHGRPLLHEPEREACGEPSQGGGHRTHFRHRNKQRIAEEESYECPSGNSQDSNRRRQKYRMNRSKALMDCPATAIGEQQAAGRNEIAVKTLEQPKECHDHDQPHRPLCSQGLFECDSGCESLSYQTLPGRDVSHRRYSKHVKTGTD